MKLPYNCPRCDYKTSLKSDMRKHLYNLRKVCPGQANNIELTDEIRECVLENRRYVVPDPFKELKLKELQQKVEKGGLQRRYTCPRCGFFCNSKKDIMHHFNNPCQGDIIDIEMTKDIQQEVISSRNNDIYNVLIKKVKELHLDVQYYKNKKSEVFYQKMLEEYLGGTHQKVDCMIWCIKIRRLKLLMLLMAT